MTRGVGGARVELRSAGGRAAEELVPAPALARLARRARAASGAGVGPAGRPLPATADAERLGRALASGGCVLVAATVRYGGAGVGGCEGAVDLSCCDSVAPRLPGWPAFSRPGGQARLVGFARASTDFRIVATIDDVAVAPEIQRRGVGRTLIKRLLRDLGRLGVEDVALTAPGDAAEAFFAHCGFGDDPLGAVPMFAPLLQPDEYPPEGPHARGGQWGPVTRGGTDPGLAP